MMRIQSGYTEQTHAHIDLWCDTIEWIRRTTGYESRFRTLLGHTARVLNTKSYGRKNHTNSIRILSETIAITNLLIIATLAYTVGIGAVSF